MKWLKYTFRTVVTGTDMEGNPVERETVTEACVPDNESGRALAEKEAYGEITPHDDGQEEPEQQPTPEQRIAELEAALEMLLSGVTE